MSLKLNNYRRKIVFYKRVVVLALVIVFLFGFQFLFSQIYEYSRASGISSQKIISLVNIERRNKGLPELATKNQIMSAASKKAQDMSSKSYFSHYSPAGKRGVSFISDQGYSYEKSGENLAVYFSTELEIVTAWMNSSGHRQNILNADFIHTGVAVAQGKYDNVDTFFVVQLFAKPVPEIVPEVRSNSPKTNATQSQPQKVDSTVKTDSNTQRDTNPEPEQKESKKVEEKSTPASNSQPAQQPKSQEKRVAAAPIESRGSQKDSSEVVDDKNIVDTENESNPEEVDNQETTDDTKVEIEEVKTGRDILPDSTKECEQPGDYLSRLLSIIYNTITGECLGGN